LEVANQQNAPGYYDDISNPNWILKCSNIDEWKDFPEDFADSVHESEQRFYHYIIHDLLPHIINDIKVRVPYKVRRGTQEKWVQA
jgi:hypothetical protein